MDNNLLERANKINEDIQKISSFIKKMDTDNGYYHYYEQYYWPQELKDVIRPIFKEYQEKLFLQLKNL